MQAAERMSSAEHHHRMVEQLRLDADRSKASAQTQQQAAATATQQAALLVQGLRGMERAAKELDDSIRALKE